MVTQGASSQWLHRSTEKYRRVCGQVPFSTYLTHVRKVPSGAWFSSLQATVHAWQPMHLRWSITKPYRTASPLFAQHVPPDAHAGEHDRDEEYAPERIAGQPAACQRPQLRAGHGAERDHERRAERHLAGDELADHAGSRGERRAREPAADGHADRGTDDHEQQRAEQKR